MKAKWRIRNFYISGSRCIVNISVWEVCSIIAHSQNGGFVTFYFNFNFNLIQRALVLEDYAPALGVAGFVSRKKGARSKGKEEKEGKK